MKEQALDVFFVTTRIHASVAIVVKTWITYLPKHVSLILFLFSFRFSLFGRAVNAPASEEFQVGSRSVPRQSQTREILEENVGHGRSIVFRDASSRSTRTSRFREIFLNHEYI